MTKYLSKEQEPVVWTVALNELGKIYSMFVEDEATIELFKVKIFSKIDLIFI